ncbi:hypothetical protein PR003_g15410 [Phytophthora rubi]|uniref:Protein kinase domain-containing protein n=1 Tax=Phytophthora rubi TaxID=129364 RepID=A0A6A4F7C7_9STRA|nr:hypothetical protein PR003_g15410 [Phytophthora rubi]
MTEVVELECAVYGEATVFPVKIGRNADVEALQRAIVDEKKDVNDRFKVGPATLTLYLARKKGETTWMKHDRNTESFLQGGIDTDYEKLLSSWKLTKAELLGPDFQPGDEEIHVLVELPDAQQNAVGPADLMPSFDEEFIEQELPVKIALPERIRDTWMAKMKIPSSDLMAKMFRVANSEPCLEFMNQIGYRVVQPGGTEKSFVSFWDDLIRRVLNFVGIGKSERNPSRSASTGPNRPNYLFFVDSVCVFRGVEKAPGRQIATPRRELVEKLVWNYGDAPYLLGYAAVGYEVRLYAITRTHNDVDAIELGVYDLKYLEGRFRWMLAMLHVARLLPSLASLCPDSAREEYTKIVRDQGIKVLLEPSRMVKCFPEALFQRAKDHAEAVYKVLEEHVIPNVDRLDHADEIDMRLIFKPRGQETKPTNLAELFHALANVLQALVKLHAVSWMHRDIRWLNVIKTRDGHNSWFLIDFMAAAQSPQDSPSGHHLSRLEHAPEIFSDGSHTTAVDVWSVGRLIQTCGDEVYGSWYDTGRERTQFLEQLMHRDPSRRPTAVDALDRLRQLEQEYLERQKMSGRKKKSRWN